MKNKLKIVTSVLWTMVVLGCVSLLLITFLDLPFIPTISEITGQEAKAEETADSITFLNVGEGDAILVKSNNRFALIDTGDGLSTDIIRELKSYGVKGLDALILTHWHTDHVGAATQILKEFKVLNLVVPKLPESLTTDYKTAKEITKLASDNKASHILARQGLVITIGDFRLSVLYCNPEDKTENNSCAVIMAKCGNYKFLLMSDAESELEQKLVKEKYNLDCDVIKIGHHGSSGSTTNDLLDIATPNHAVISVGADNNYNHPAGKVLDLLHYANVNILRTDKVGNIEFHVENEELVIKCSNFN
ncbi:MAG: MBL fold metallo-hydrolase [Ruminococcaceae bacterium]|nr:MBL fold metallo-hydrolase [Oscillospiraceae bacterium]